MKVKINIINTLYILMSEAVTVPSLMIITLTAFDETLARDRQTDTHTHTHTHIHTDAHSHFT